jgi:hypothetical protein
MKVFKHAEKLKEKYKCYWIRDKRVPSASQFPHKS